MRNLLMIKEWYQGVYSKYGLGIDVAIKFLLSLLAIILINQNIGAMTLLENPLIIFAVAVVCAVVPKGFMIFILTLLIPVHILALSIEMGAFVMAVLIIMFLVYLRFATEDGCAVICVPVLFCIQIPFVMPLLLGLIGTPFSIISVACGTVVYFLMNYVHIHYEELAAASSTDGLSMMSEMARDVFTDQTMYLLIIAFSVTLIAVYVIRRLSVRYSWQIACVTGVIIQTAILLAGNHSFGVSDVLSLPVILVGNIISLLLMTVLSFLLHNVDYERVEHVQFEDDDYYYYVKAVPKITVSAKKGKKHSSGKRH